MKICRLTLFQLVIGFISSLIPMNLSAQTSLKLNVVQPPVLTSDAGTDVTIDVFNYTILGGTPTASGGTGNYTYNWEPDTYLNDMTLANPVAQPMGNTLFKVTVTDEKGCISEDEIQITVIGGSSVENHDGVNFLTIFPNPASAIVSIKLNNPWSSLIHIDIINMSGQIVYQSIIENNELSVYTEINLSDLSRGYYIMHIYGDIESAYEQIILN